MNIDWLTTIAQIINFLILIWLLKRFLYKPVLNAIDERDRKITARMEEAATNKEEALKEKEDYIQKKDELQQKKDELMDDAITEAKSYQSKLMDEARISAQDFSKKLQSSLNKMELELKDEVSNKLQQEVFEIADKALIDLSSVNLQDQILSTFIKKINDLNEDDKLKFRQAFNGSANSVLVSSAFELTKDQRNLIDSILKKILKEDMTTEYKTTPRLICGIELYANGYKLGWSISEYLTALQTELFNSSFKENKLKQIAETDNESEIIQNKDIEK
jgi:F-type H+-transporting ATPase subunit b